MYWLFLLPYVLLSFLSNAQVTLKQVDPFRKVLEHERNVAVFSETHPVAFGETLTLQLLLQSTQKNQGVKLTFSSSTITKKTLDQIKVYRQGYIKVSPMIMAPATDMLSSPDNRFPDPLFAESNFSLSPNRNLPITIELPVTNEIKIGWHQVFVEAIDAAKKVVAKTDFTFRLYNVKVPAKKLNYVNWYHDGNYELSNNGRPIQLFSEAYWERFKQIVQACKDYGQNIFTVNPFYLIQFKKNKDVYAADYTYLDKAIDIILNEVGMDYVLARQFATRQAGWESQFGMQMPKFYTATEYMMDVKPIYDAEVLKFYNWFIPSYYGHLKSKRLLSKYLQHIADEPIAANKNSYKDIASFIRRKTPGLKIIEAVSDADLAAYIDILVVQLGELSFRYDDVMRKVKAAKKEVWSYTANHPQGNYANRFIELPLIKTRLLPWVAFRYDMRGYLHWGLNLWGRKPYEDASKVQYDGVIEFPGGDAYIIYPAYKSVVVSTRFLEMRNGLNDVALLELLKQKNPRAANSIALQLVKDFQNYQTDSKVFLAKKKEILELLSR